MDILDLIREGDRQISANDDAEQLRRAAERFLGVYASYPGFGVVSASPHAERVLGAAMMLDPDLHAGPADSVIVLDLNVASGTLIARALGRLRDAGHRGIVVGVALNRLHEHADHLSIAGLATLVIADDTHGSSVAEASKCGNHRVTLAG